MARISEGSLIDAGCDARLIERVERHLEMGNEKACLNLLRAHRCELVEAMHEAQRPIDVCDWIIREVELSHA